MKEFGERLKKLRQSKKMTQDELGLIFDPPLAQSTIGTYERGVSEPTYSNLVIIAKHFRTTTDYLLGLTDQLEAEIEVIEEEPKELREFLHQNNILFNGLELSEEDKKRMIDILTGLFWSNFTNKK
jgi:transcriptional regulator with XRE-family HTH domain